MDIGKKKLNALNVVSNKEHKGFGAGAIDLNNVSSVIIDGDEAYIDLGAMHAKSKVERGIKFSSNKEDVPNGRRCWIVWVAVDKNAEAGPRYAGVTACEMLVDEEARKGWKVLADHVNRMDYAMKRRIMVEGLNEAEKAALKRCLQNYNEEIWNNSGEELKKALEV
ncbi:YwhD family protein [Paenibacillus alkalitolerans]|uniref:YwhD family protein n=1 Tax=Paenibacillus alkalitolerans TaxID=2799335 RepID=UPI0018F65520|nr:YwhD family protein [Paenibacillus alkalitolerans]